jgi:hypothetical protein
MIFALRSSLTRNFGDMGNLEVILFFLEKEEENVKNGIISLFLAFYTFTCRFKTSYFRLYR